MTEGQLQEEKVEALRNAYATVFSGDAAKLVMQDLEKECTFNDSSVRTMPIDPYQVVYNEGKRRVCLRIKGMIEKGKL